MMSYGSSSPPQTRRAPLPHSPSKTGVNALSLGRGWGWGSCDGTRPQSNASGQGAGLSEAGSLARYWNNDVLANIDQVLEDIHGVLTTTPTPNPSPQGGGEYAEFATADVLRCQRRLPSRSVASVDSKKAVTPLTRPQF